MRIPLVAGLFVALPLTLALNGCTYLLRDGVALYSRDQVAERFKPADAEELTQWRERALEADPEGTVVGTQRVHRARNDYGWLWVDDRVEFRAGREITLPATDDMPERTITYRDNVLKSRQTGLPAVIYGESEYQLHDLESGEPYARAWHQTALLYLYYRGGMEKPRDDKRVAPHTLGPLAWEVDQYNYTSTSGTALIWGLLAAGQKNGRAYAQILWIPIPLWRTTPAPEPVTFERDAPADKPAGQLAME
jgi:hypothetical protein